jgi:hypothetical protein
MTINNKSSNTRPGHNAKQVAKCVYDFASKRNDTEYELVDLKDYNLPLLDEAYPSLFGLYLNEHTLKPVQLRLIKN